MCGFWQNCPLQNFKTCRRHNVMFYGINYSEPLNITFFKKIEAGSVYYLLFILDGKKWREKQIWEKVVEKTSFPKMCFQIFDSLFFQKHCSNKMLIILEKVTENPKLLKTFFLLLERHFYGGIINTGSRNYLEWCTKQ